MVHNLSDSKSIVPYRRKTPQVRLFCFPYAGGGASIFRIWNDILPEKIEIYAVQPPGRESRISEAPIADVHVLVDELLSSLQDYLDMPFAFFGYSTGALVAFELARELRRKSLPSPLHLLVAAARAPHIPEPSPLHHLPEEELVEGLKRFSGTPNAILENKEIMRLYIPIIRADLAIEETYNHKKEDPLDIPISAFYGSNDKEGPKDVMIPWNKYTSKEFLIHKIEGNHFFINSSTESLLSAISYDLERYCF
ncbi:MAG: putative thioesterase [Desulfobulbus propionicus]|nr:MAG: putative thioesterase [Desulfobulbus propionicus]